LDSWTVISHILILLFASLALGTLAVKLRQNAVIGYIFAGMLVGPNVLGIIEARKEMLVIAELGASLILFNIGLGFSFKKLLSIGGRIYVGGLLQILLTGTTGLIIAVGFGASVFSAVAIGAAVAMSSTACVIKILGEKTQSESVHGRYAIGILLLQDMAIVPLIFIVSYLGRSPAQKPLLLTTVMAVGLITLMYVALNKIAPLVLSMRSFSKNRDFPVIFGILIALGTAWCAHWAGISPTLGAFIAGMLLAQSPYAKQIKSDISALGVLLVTMFFASLGMFGNPKWVMQNWIAVLGCVTALIFIKPFVVWLSLIIMKFPKRISLATGITLFQIGEFSFVILAISHSTGLLGLYVFRLLISATVITLLLTPYMMVLASRLAYDKPTGCDLAAAGSVKDEPAAGRPVIVVGLGPSGRRVMEMLKDEFAGHLIVVDINAKNKHFAEKANVEFHAGDATASGFLQSIGAGAAKAIIVTIPDHHIGTTIISVFKNLAPEDSLIISRVRNQMFKYEYERMGIDHIIDEEEITGYALGESALHALGKGD
jgi:CPA2 family monovalent cation:H+ antiporter-2